MEYVEFQYKIVDELAGEICNYCCFEFEGEIYELIYRIEDNRHNAILQHILAMKNLGVNISRTNYNQ